MVPGSCRPRRRLPKIKFVYPYIVRPLRNFDKVYPIFTISFLDGTTRRAWLNPPEAAGEVATIHLLSTREELGCYDRLHTVTVETNMVEAGKPIPQNTPVTFALFNPAVGNFFMGCAEGDGGRVLYSAEPCYTAAPTDSWWVIAADFWTTNQPNVTTGVPLVAGTTSTGRVLRALATRDPRVFELGFVPVEANVGLDLSFVLVSTDLCCGGESSLATVGPCIDPVTGAAL
jgi:hypothetical protein